MHHNIIFLIVLFCKKRVTKLRLLSLLKRFLANIRIHGYFDFRILFVVIYNKNQKGTRALRRRDPVTQFSTNNIFQFNAFLIMTLRKTIILSFNNFKQYQTNCNLQIVEYRCYVKAIQKHQLIIQVCVLQPNSQPNIRSIQQLFNPV